MTKEVKIALLMALSLFMEILDGTIVTTALPKIAAFFHTSLSRVSLLISVYLVTAAVFIPLSGWLAKRYGKRNIWLVAVLLFTLSSLGSALVTNFFLILLMRFAQGLAGAMITPTARLIVLEGTPASKMLKMTSFLIWPALLAPVLAPVVGGLMVTYWSWQWIFLINLPLGLLAVLLGIWLIPRDWAAEKRPFDWLGFLMIAGASFLMMAGAQVAGGKQFWGGMFCILAGLSLLFPIYKHLQQSSDPLLSLDVLNYPSFRVSQLSGSLLWLSIGSLPYLLPIFLQLIFGWSAARSGGYLVSVFLGNIVMKPFAGLLIERFRYKNTLLLSFAVICFSSVGFFFAGQADWSVLYIIILTFLSGLGRSLALTAFTGLSFSELKTKERNSANTLFAVTQSLAQGVGVSLVTLFVTVCQSFTSANLSYRAAFVFLGILMILPAFEVFKLPEGIGENTLKTAKLN